MSIPPPSGSQQPQDPFGPPPVNRPQGAPGYGPYGPAAPLGRPYGTPVSVNALAVAALVLGVLCFLPAAGLGWG